MVLSWFRSYHRRTIVAQPFPDAWQGHIARNVAHYGVLTPDEQQELHEDIQVFIAEKYWEGAHGLEVTEEMQVTVAALACILTLHREHDYYPNVETIILYPSGYTAPECKHGPGGIVEEGVSARLGEAWNSGPIVLSWADVCAGGRNDTNGHNVVYHEFAHKLDMRNGGTADGVPRLEDDAAYDQWADTMSREYAQLVAASQHGRATLLDSYGATNAAEFFAVATECFFERATRMQQSHPALYDALRGFYKQDPAAAHAQHAANAAVDTVTGGTGGGSREASEVDDTTSAIATPVHGIAQATAGHWHAHAPTHSIPHKK